MFHGRIPPVLLIVPLLGAGGCSTVERWSSTKINGTLAPPPVIDSSGHVTMWSFLPGTLYRYPPLATKPDCDPRNDGFVLRPGRRRSWLVGKDQLYHFDGCGNRQEVRLSRSLQFAPEAAAVVGDDHLLVAAIANKEENLPPLWVLRLLDGKQIEDVYLQGKDLQGEVSIPDNPGPDPVRLIRSRSGDKMIWVVVRDLLCKFGDDLRQPQPNGRTCSGIRLSATIHDVADTGASRPVWIATEKGGFAWRSPPSLASLEPIPQLNHKTVSIAADPVDADVAWALDDGGGLYRLKLSPDPAERVRPVALGTNNVYRHVRVVHNRVLLLGNYGVDECLRCKSSAPDGSPAVQTLAVGVYEEAYPGPGGAIWLSARNEGALYTPAIERRLPLPALPLLVTVMGVMVLVAGGAILVRRRLGRDVVTSLRKLDRADEDHQDFKMAVDFAILTAIEVERRAVCMALGLGDEHRVKKGARVYWRGSFPLNGGEAYEIVVSQSPDMANVDAALLTSDMLHHWSPGAALMVGIAASTEPGQVKLGDVVVADAVYYYEREKVTPSITKPEPKMIPADATLWSNVTALPEWKTVMTVARPDASTQGPRVHFGVIASGEKVLADEATRDQIAARHRKILAIEMEGFGFSRAVWQSFDRVRHLVMRGICDDGSVAKDDRWHGYAAAAVAEFAKHFLLDRPLDPVASVSFRRGQTRAR